MTHERDDHELPVVLLSAERTRNNTHDPRGPPGGVGSVVASGSIGWGEKQSERKRVRERERETSIRTLKVVGETKNNKKNSEHEGGLENWLVCANCQSSPSLFVRRKREGRQKKREPRVYCVERSRCRSASNFSNSSSVLQKPLFG